MIIEAIKKIKREKIEKKLVVVNSVNPNEINKKILEECFELIKGRKHLGLLLSIRNPWLFQSKTAFIKVDQEKVNDELVAIIKELDFVFLIKSQDMNLALNTFAFSIQNAAYTDRKLH